MIQQPEARAGAAPQDQVMQGQAPGQSQGQPQGQGQKLPPDQMAALRADPEIQQAIEKFMGGKKVDMQQVPDQLLTIIAGMVHKLGVDGAIQEFIKLVPPNVVQEFRGAQK